MLLEVKSEAGFLTDCFKQKVGESYGFLKRKTVKALQAALRQRFRGENTPFFGASIFSCIFVERSRMMITFQAKLEIHCSSFH